MAKGHNNQDQVEETQGGAEQPQQEPTVAELEQLAAETEAPREEVTPQPVTEPVAETPQAPVVVTPEVKRTPLAIAQTNQQKAAELRELYAPQLNAIGNNMSEKIRLLHREGLSKGDISRVLQIQFQFVRNVVFNYDMKMEKEAQAAAAAAAAKAAQPTTAAS